MKNGYTRVITVLLALSLALHIFTVRALGAIRQELHGLQSMSGADRGNAGTPRPPLGTVVAHGAGRFMGPEHPGTHSRCRA